MFMRRNLTLLLVLALLLVWDMTFVRWKGAGLADLAGEQRMVVEDFLFDVEGLCLDDSPIRGLIRHRHVSVGAERHRCEPIEWQDYITGRVGEPPDAISFQIVRGRPYTMSVDYYTVLGLPLIQMRQEACTRIVECESGQLITIP